MQFIFHPVQSPASSVSCVVRTHDERCSRPARYIVDAEQADLASTILEVGSVDGMWVPWPPATMVICLHHASKVIAHDHASFRVVPVSV
jgi:hypothetical protein